VAAWRRVSFYSPLELAGVGTASLLGPIERVRACDVATVPTLFASNKDAVLGMYV
jgi:hypothetical protein